MVSNSKGLQPRRDTNKEDGGAPGAAAPPAAVCVVVFDSPDLRLAG